MTAPQIAARIRPNAEADAHTTLDVYGVRFRVVPSRGEGGVMKLDVELMTRTDNPHGFRRTHLGSAATPEAAAVLILAARDSV